ncbi:MAG: hypothetical protein AAFX51_01785 [Cyanobacteria bacterium J06636_28]
MIGPFALFYGESLKIPINRLVKGEQPVGSVVGAMAGFLTKTLSKATVLLEFGLRS